MIRFPSANSGGGFARAAPFTAATRQISTAASSEAHAGIRSEFPLRFSCWSAILCLVGTILARAVEFETIGPIQGIFGGLYERNCWYVPRPWAIPGENHSVGTAITTFWRKQTTRAMQSFS